MIPLTHTGVKVRTRDPANPPFHPLLTRAGQSPFCLPTIQPAPPHCTPLHPTAHHCPPLHPTALHCIPLHTTAHHCTPLHPTAPITLQPTALHCTPLHTTAPHSTSHHCTPLHTTALHCTVSNLTALNRIEPGAAKIEARKSKSPENSVEESLLIWPKAELDHPKIASFSTWKWAGKIILVSQFSVAGVKSSSRQPLSRAPTCAFQHKILQLTK